MSCPSCLPTYNDPRIARGAEFSIFRGGRPARGNDFPQNRSCENGNLAHARIKCPTCEGASPTSYPATRRVGCAGTRPASGAPHWEVSPYRTLTQAGHCAVWRCNASGKASVALLIDKGSTIFGRRILGLLRAHRAASLWYLTESSRSVLTRRLR